MQQQQRLLLLMLNQQPPDVRIFARWNTHFGLDRQKDDGRVARASGARHARCTAACEVSPQGGLQ